MGRFYEEHSIKLESTEWVSMAISKQWKKKKKIFGLKWWNKEKFEQGIRAQTWCNFQTNHIKWETKKQTTEKLGQRMQEVLGMAWHLREEENWIVKQILTFLTKRTLFSKDLNQILQD